MTSPLASRQTSSATFESLPQELINHIVTFLDSPSAVPPRIHDKPRFHITASNTIDLKNVALVDWRLRRAALPLLFRHSRILVDDVWNWSASLPASFEKLMRFLGTHQLELHVETLVFGCGYQGDSRTLSRWDIETLANVWKRSLETLNIRELTIIAKPEVLGALTGCLTESDDSWVFEMDYHMLRLCCSPAGNRDDPSVPRTTARMESNKGWAATPDEDPRRYIFRAKPWTSMLLNEGSFIKAFRTYEYYHKVPSSILPTILGHSTGIEEDDGVTYPHNLFPPTLREFGYVAVFPTQTHFQSLTTRLPPVDKLFVQLTPTDDVLKDKMEMAKIDMRDLWMERNHCYSMIMRELYDVPPGGNFKHLGIFESGDAADRDAWDMAVHFTERHGGWRVERPGIFIRTGRGDNDSLHGSIYPGVLSV